MKKLISISLQIFGLLTALTIVLGGLGLYFAEKWLLVNKEPVKSDFIVVQNGVPYRAIYGADLYNKGYAPVVYVGKAVVDPLLTILQEEYGICTTLQEEVYKKILVKKNVPEKVIRFFGNGHISTVEEAEALKRTIGDKPVKLLIVSSPLSSRRASIIFSDVLPHAKICVVSNPYEQFTGKWWTNRNVATTVVLETIKSIFYKLGGAFRSTDTPSQAVVAPSSQ